MAGLSDKHRGCIITRDNDPDKVVDAVTKMEEGIDTLRKQFHKGLITPFEYATYTFQHAATALADITKEGKAEVTSEEYVGAPIMQAVRNLFGSS